ncbi:MAG: hypothetical protein IPN76_06775 [Saprospiraceae bacterium]|nr:hypothetical protein [Saprospiraceae bacterium]
MRTRQGEAVKGDVLSNDVLNRSAAAHCETATRQRHGMGERGQHGELPTIGRILQ